MEEILDDLNEPDLPPSRKGIDKAILIYSIITTFLFLFNHFIIKKNLPINLGGYSFFTISSMCIFIIFITVCNLFVRKANRLAPTAEEKLFVIWGASPIFYSVLIFRFIIDFINYGNISPSTIWYTLKISMAMSIIAGSISYIVINRIRGNDMIIPYIILIGIWIATGFLLKIIL